MSYPDIEPLEPAAWLDLLEHLARQRPADETSLIPVLRRAFHLVQLAPRPLRYILGRNMPEAEFEQLLENGASLQVTEALIGERLVYSIDLAPGGVWVAEVRFPAEGLALRTNAASAAAALFTAWLECLHALIRPDDAPAARHAPRESASLPGLRKFRSVPRPKLTEH